MAIARVAEYEYVLLVWLTPPPPLPDEAVSLLRVFDWSCPDYISCGSHSAIDDGDNFAIGGILHSKIAEARGVDFG